MNCLRPEGGSVPNLSIILFFNASFTGICRGIHTENQVLSYHYGVTSQNDYLSDAIARQYKGCSVAFRANQLGGVHANLHLEALYMRNFNSG